MLSREEQETIICFNKADKEAHIFTYEKTWQSHLEKKLWLKPIYKNSHGGKEYEIPKSRIKMPHAKRTLSKAHKEKLSAILRRPPSPQPHSPATGQSTVQKTRKVRAATRKS